MQWQNLPLIKNPLVNCLQIHIFLFQIIKDLMSRILKIVKRFGMILLIFLIIKKVMTIIIFWEQLSIIQTKSNLN